ncbi:MAG TPA: acyl-CoA dehydrogenase family protein [Aldersonia sp.]
MDRVERDLLADTLRKAMTSTSGADLDAALVQIGWPELLAEYPDDAIGLVFGMLGETGSHAPLINDVVAVAAGRPVGGVLALPYAGDRWVRWARDDTPSAALDPAVPVHIVATGEPVPLAAGRRALGWWLVGTGRAMLALASTHALDRTQFGRPIASFQAVRHRLAETLVALEAAEATLAHADDEFGALLAKAAAGRAALTAARHCQQVLGGIGFTAEHGLHRHVRHTLLLDGLLGSSRELTRAAGARVRAAGRAQRLASL